jgi:hypothetical protein
MCPHPALKSKLSAGSDHPSFKTILLVLPPHSACLSATHTNSTTCKGAWKKKLLNISPLLLLLLQQHHHQQPAPAASIIIS